MAALIERSLVKNMKFSPKGRPNIKMFVLMDEKKKAYRKQEGNRQYP